MRNKEIKLKNISNNPYYFPFELEWKDLKISKMNLLKDVYSFLDKNYIEDPDLIFRFNYLHEFLAFSIKGPGWHSFFNLGFSFLRGKKLLGIIIAIPKFIISNSYLQVSTEINYLCLLKKFRCKHFIVFLIQEITRRLNVFGILQAIFTTSIIFSESFTKSCYYHYPISLEKLVEFEFIKSKNLIKISENIKKNSKDLIDPIFLNLIWDFSLRKIFFKYEVYAGLDKKSFFNLFRIIHGIFYMIFLKKKKKFKILSFYFLPNKLIKKKKKKFLYTAYLFLGFFKISIIKCYQKLFIFLNNLNFDLLNVLDSYSQRKILDRFNFKKGTGRLRFYNFNWDCGLISFKKNALMFF
jgi:hypothetical protein